MSRIVVTGGAGFIGSHLCEALLRRGHEVIALDSFDDFYDPSIKRRNLSAAMSHRGFTLVEGDIRNPEAVRSAVRDGVEVIVHLAARAGVRPSIEMPLLYQDVNVGGTMVLLEVCRKVGSCKFIFGSSSSVYGNNPKVPFAEDDRVDRPISPYAATKRAGELLAHTYHHLFGMPVTCLRFFTVYGSRQRPDLAIHKFVRLMEADRPIPMFGDGSMARDYTYIDDIVDGIIRAMDRCNGYHTYNLGGANPIPLRDLIGQIESATGRKATIERLPQQAGDVDRTCADVSLARRDLGFQPCMNLPTGLARFVEWFRTDASRT